ncbi:MAG: hypothetical protein LUG57_02790 [Oscillospiraceae bacterium]|nr:hypothetical protein [Oscillospiraceae bacterium]
MEQLIVPKDNPAQAAFCMDGDYMAPYIPQGAVVMVEWELPETGQCGLFRADGQILVRQYCEDSFGNIHLLVLNRARRELDVTIPPGQAVECLGRLMMENVPLPLD